MFSAIKNSMNPDIPRSIFKEYCELYRRIGAGENTIKELNERAPLYKDLTMKDDIYYLFRSFFPDAKISDLRLKQIADNKFLDNPKNTEEIIAINLRRIFDQIEHGTPFKVDNREIQDLSLMLMKGTPYGNSLKKHTQGEKTYRDKLEELTLEYKKIINNEDVEKIYLNIAFYVDLYVLSPFKYHNDIISIIVLYCLMVESNIKSIRYFSFFKALSSKMKELNEGLLKAEYHYTEGVSDFTLVSRIILNILKESYDSLEMLYENLSFDKQLSKSKNIEVIIYNLPEVFTKDDIRKKLPGISDSTIDRKLKELQDENRIASYGRGRTAKWVRIDHSHDEKTDFSRNFE